MMQKPAARVWAFAAALCLVAPALAAEPGVLDEDAENSPNPAKHCLSLTRIDRTEILDSQHLVFHTRGKEHYLNTLSNPCPGLRKDTPYMVRSSSNRVCNLDIITVLSSTGVGFMPGASCGLNMFEPIDENQLAAVKSELEGSSG